MNNQLALYKEEQKKKHQEHIKKINLQKKIIALLKDKSKNPPNIIQNFARKYVLRNTINNLPNVPGLYKKRIAISEFNYFDHEIQKQMESGMNKENEDNYNSIIKEITADVHDEAIKKAIIESLNINGNIVSQKISNPIMDTIYWIQIDLRIFGQQPEIPYYMEEIDMMLYFTKSQQADIKDMWNSIDPSITKGLKYKQMLDCSKSLVELYNMKIS